MTSYEKDTFCSSIGDYCTVMGIDPRKIQIQSVSVSTKYFGIFDGRAYKKAVKEYNEIAKIFDTVVDFREGQTQPTKTSLFDFFFGLHHEGYQMRGTGIKMK